MIEAIASTIVLTTRLIARKVKISPTAISRTLLLNIRYAPVSPCATRLRLWTPNSRTLGQIRRLAAIPPGLWQDSLRKLTTGGEGANADGSGDQDQGAGPGA